MRRCNPIDPMTGEKPQTLDERLREGKSMEDGLAGRADMYASPLDRPFDQWKPSRKIHGTTRGRHDDDQY